MLTPERINELVAIYIFEDHTTEMIEEIHAILAKNPPEDHDDIREQNGLFNCAEDMNDVFLILNDPKFNDDWGLQYEADDGLYDAEIFYNGIHYWASADHPAVALCLAALIAVGAVEEIGLRMYAETADLP